MATYYKTDARGVLRLYTVHDLQRSLLGNVALTFSTSIGGAYGNEKLRIFDTAEQAEKWLSATLAAKRRAGYRTLYEYAGNGSRDARVRLRVRYPRRAG